MIRNSAFFLTVATVTFAICMVPFPWSATLILFALVVVAIQ